ncbi:hypothetical protein [Sorangium sp. So ce426]|uniref:hypothetical protein n=1 Tax=Sorangium sp. So ce426 TaxID=3133312 RepID=UPI003F5C6CC9
MAARRPSRAARAAASLLCSLVVGGISLLPGCLSRPIAHQDTRTTGTVVERLPRRVDKIDLLLTIDNSSSMKDKQDILALAVPDLVRRLVDPRCIDPLNPLDSSPPGEDGRCPSGKEREFEPVVDIHIGIISTSLGSHGADSCPEESLAFFNNDKGHLIARSDRDDRNDADNDPPTYQNLGFLAWDPEQKLSPAGESILDDGAGRGLVPTLTNMVRGVADNGCGFESQLESWYRFLVDPAPYETLEVVNGKAERRGVDKKLLDQRKAFLRPDSLLAIVMLSDENDCSIKEGGNAFWVARQKDDDGDVFRMFAPRRECAEKGLDDPCCKSCGTPRGECPLDKETCGPEGQPKTLPPDEDPHNLRCFDQKRRFGIDLLYPIDRYTDALTLARIEDHQGNIVDNPLFSDLDPEDENSAVRPPEYVFFAGLVGVPWQDIARQDDAGQPNLREGRDQDGNRVGGFKSAKELSTPNASFASTWDIILGDPKSRRSPGDPHMIESPVPREGQNPITGTRIAGPDSPDDANDINGHEWNPNPDFGDLQYACTFRLLESVTGDDCKSTEDRNSPLCKDNPDGTDSNLQVNAKAYPGLRQLELIRNLGEQGIVGSVCPAQLDFPAEDRLDFGYRPAIGAIVDRLKTKLGGQCLPRALQPNESGQVSCLVLEARSTAEGKCGCDGLTARREVLRENLAAKRMVLEDPVAAVNGWNCVCEVEQLKTPEELAACQDTVPPAPVEVGGEKVHGWCYVDPRLGFGRDEVVAKCPSTERRQVRFTGDGAALDGATQFVICTGDTANQ